MNAITSFSGEYAFLGSYFVGEPLVFGQYRAATAEHLFSAMKARRGEDFRRILTSATPEEAHADGRRLLALRPDWGRVKLDVMRYVLSLKFSLVRTEGVCLVATETRLLMEANPKGDRTWGAVLPDDHGVETAVGRNWQGVLLMARRAELLAEGLGEASVNYAETLDYIRYKPATVDR